MGADVVNLCSLSPTEKHSQMEATMGFLPDDYQAPERNEGGAYFKPKKGDNRVRILSSAIFGYQYWNDQNKPVRSKKHPGSPVDRRINDQGKPEAIKFFWACVIWNYELQAVAIWEFTQGSIQRAIENLNDSEEWGDPREYDLTIKRSGEGLDTEYAVIPSPPKPLTDAVKQVYTAANIDLTALYRGENPFGGESATTGMAGRAALMAETLGYFEQLKWSKKACSAYIQKKFKKPTRDELTDQQLAELAFHLIGEIEAIDQALNADLQDVLAAF